MWWLPTASLLVIGLALWVTSGLYSLSFSPLVLAREEAARTVAVREAIDQHTAAQADGGTGAVRTIRLQVSEQPGAAAFDVPIPFDARARRPRSGGSRSDTEGPDRVVLGTASDVPAVLAFYRAALEARGWHEVRAWLSRPTVGVDGPGGAVSAFCQGADQPALLVGVVSTPDGVSELRLMIHSDQPGPCSSSSTPDSPWNEQAPPVF